MQILRWLLRVMAAIICLALLAIPFFIRKTDRTPYQQTVWYANMLERLDSFSKTAAPMEMDTVLLAGWSKVNITPTKPMPTAGYGKREGKAVRVVHDSLYVRCIWLQRGNTKAAIVSADLLIIPPEVTIQVKKAIAAAGIEWSNVYIGATHTHNSMGGWGKRYIGELFAGKYDQELVNNLAAQIIQAIDMAKKRAGIATVEFEEKNAAGFVTNRVLGESAPEFPMFQSLYFLKQNGEKISLHSFAAHATTLSDTVMQFSRDYPGLLVDSLESDGSFAMFMAGAVGSMGPVEPKGSDWSQLQFMTDGLATVLMHDTANFRLRIQPALRVATFPLEMREPQWRFAKNWCFRHWLWSRLYGDYEMEVKALRIGNVLMVGMPCDFGGELMEPLRKYALSKGRQLVITSFNGGYCGYITPDERYDADGYETRIMNWFGPGNAAYFSEVVKRLVDAM